MINHLSTHNAPVSLLQQITGNFLLFLDKNFPETWKTEGKYKRTGAHNEKMAVYGNSKTFFYRTPYSFFSSVTLLIILLHLI